MSFDYLCKLVTAQLDRRVAAERKNVSGSTGEPRDLEAYFKEVFAGQIL